MRPDLFTKLLIMALPLMILSASKTLAQEDFSTDYNITYKIEPSGIALVEHGVTITNLRDDVIATNYTLGLKQLDIFDVTASDSEGQLDVLQKIENDQTNLDIRLNDFVIGEGRQNSMTIYYKSKTVATKTGEVWNINIPRSQSTTSTTAYHITLIVPASFGPKIYVSPTPSLERTEGELVTYSFASGIVKDTNISASFGNYQVLNFRLRYQIQNPNRFSSNYEIALPPTIIGNQVIAYENLNPKPKDLHIDRDGNYIAVYRLAPEQNIEVEFLGSSKITSGQIDPSKGGSFKDIPRTFVARYTGSEEFWETGSKQIKDVAKSLYDDKLTVAQNARKIYDYLLQNYSYDFNIAKKDFVDRKGAAKALDNKAEWGCMEFTDSFIAIARSMKIPAREINGYALTTGESSKPVSVELKSGDLLHAWPEFYDPKFGWVQIDPTWGDTSNTDYFSKLDTSHLTFVVKGLRSDYPLPAGTYRITDGEKLVEVGYSQVDSKAKFAGNFEINKLFNWNIFSVLAGKDRLKITNVGKVSLYINQEKVLLPGKSTIIYTAKDITSIVLKDAFGEDYSRSL